MTCSLNGIARSSGVGVDAEHNMRSRVWTKSGIGLSLATLLWLVPLTNAKASSINPIVFQPAIFATDLLSVSTARVSPQFGFTAALDFHYTEAPLSFEATDDFGRSYVEETIRNRTIGEVILGFTPAEFLEFGIAMPFVLTGDGTAYRFTGEEQLSGFAIGELRTAVKGKLFASEHFGLGVQGEFTAPTAPTESMTGNGLGGGGRVIMDVYAGPFMMSLNVGAYARSEEVTIGGLTVGHELLASLGGSVDVYEGLAVLGEAYLRTQLMDPFGDMGTTVLEAMGGVRYSPHQAVAMTVAAGGGAPFLGGYGTSAFRVSGEIRYRFQPSFDRDGDTVNDRDDRCPKLPEDLDGFEDYDGCPDADNDQDGFLDALDGCPDQAEDYDEFEDEDGCPEIDNDHDTIPDEQDQCVHQAEDHDGFKDEDGCPDVDNDRDGIVDGNDSCPMEPESMNGFQDEDGCPDYPEVADEKADDEGGRIRAGVVKFGKDDRLTPKAYATIRTVCKLIVANPSWALVRVDVHVSKGGSQRRVALDARLLRSSRARAEHLRQVMVMEGVAPARLQFRAAGGAEPLVDTRVRGNETLNTRVEFFVAERL